jgi:polysaccharide biosynthesis/export protein
MRAWAVTALVASAFFWVGQSASAQRAEPLRLRAGDGVRIEIKDEPTLSGEFIIGDDGQILLPTIGTIVVASRTFDEVKQELAKSYHRELVNPVLRITPLVRVSVIGEVRLPGLFLIDPTQGVGDVLARAGGPAPTANANRITILKSTGETVAKFRLGSAPLDATLHSGDQILVQRRPWTSEHLGILLGAVGSIGVALITGAVLR